MDKSAKRLKLHQDSWFLEAVRKNHIADVRALIKMGADINPQFNVCIESPLFLAIYHGHKEMVETLLKNGAKTDIKVSDGYYPLHFAANLGKKEIVQILINHGANVDEKYEDGDTLLHQAIAMNDKAMVELLLKLAEGGPSGPPQLG